MSQVGNVEKMYGNALSIITTNAPGDKILEYGEEHVFTENSLIISSPVEIKDGELSDKGTPSILCVDHEGKPLRLTYTMQPGFGMIADPNRPDVIRMNIDKHTLNTEGTCGIIGVPEGKLRVEVDGLIDNNTSLINKDNNLFVNPGCFVDNHSLKTTARWYGGDSSLFNQNLGADFKQNEPNFIYINKENLCDGETIIADTSYITSYNRTDVKETAFSTTPWLANSYTKLKVNTAALEKATDNTFGIVKPDKTTTTISNGELIVKTSGLDKIGKGGGYGIVRTAPFETTGDPVYGDGGFIRLKTKEMTKASIYATKSTQNGFGVCAVDGKTMISDNGVLKVNTGNLSAPTANRPGVVLPDGQTIITTNAGKISVDTSRLSLATKTQYGVVKLDGETIRYNANNGAIYVHNYNEFVNDIAELIAARDQHAEAINMLRAEIANLRAQLNNTFATVFGLYTNETKNKPFTSITITRDWNAKDGGCGSIGVGSSQTTTESFYINYKPGVGLTWNITEFKSWLTVQNITFKGADNGGKDLSSMANNYVTFKASKPNDMYKVIVTLRVTKPSSAQTSNGSINFYGPNGDILQSVPVNFKYRGGDYSGSVGTPKTNPAVTCGTTGISYSAMLASGQIDRTKALVDAIANSISCGAMGIRY